MANPNPYAAPLAEVAAFGGGGVPPRGTPQPWTIGDTLSRAWEVYKANWPALTFGYLIVTAIGLLPGQVAPTLMLAGVVEKGSHTYYAIHVPLSFVGWLVGQFFTIGFLRACLRALRNDEATFGDFFAGGPRFVPYFLMEFLRTLAVAIGCLLFLVPGVILSLGYSNAPYFVIERELGPIAALSASWESTNGQKGQLFVLALAEVGILIVGFVACCLGLFVAVPVLVLLRTVVYMRMTGTDIATGNAMISPQLR